MHSVSCVAERIVEMSLRLAAANEFELSLRRTMGHGQLSHGSQYPT